MHTYYNPSVPTALTVFEPLQEGSVIEVNGNVRYGLHNYLLYRKQDFAIELLSGPSIVLHINFRFNHENAVVLNSFLNEQWESEIRHKNPLNHCSLINLKNPLQHSLPFNLRIKVHRSHYHITCNGTVLADFAHRYPYQFVQAVGLKGDFYADKVQFEGFHFKRAWGGPIDLGHNGYNAYGTDKYVAPVFISSFQPFVQSTQPFVQIAPPPIIIPPQHVYYRVHQQLYNPYR